jgi:hypothetical protein
MKSKRANADSLTSWIRKQQQAPQMSRREIMHQTETSLRHSSACQFQVEIENNRVKKHKEAEAASTDPIHKIPAGVPP